MSEVLSRILMGDSGDYRGIGIAQGEAENFPKKKGEAEMRASVADVFFGLFEEGDGSLESVSSGANSIDDEEEGCEDVESVAKRKSFWEAQHQLLNATLSRTSSLESKIRHTTKEALKEIRSAGEVCRCPRPVYGGCRKCLLRDMCTRIRNAGFDCAIYKSKWRSSPDIPSGEHAYLDVVDKVSSKKGEVVRVVIEVNFRAEFEIAKANEEYNGLVNRLPEVFVGKEERLKTLIKILCPAAKKCMKEKKMHMGPWRKQKYMQAKWFGTSARTMLGVPVQRVPSKPKASMLTFDLLEKLPTMQHFTAVAVV
ncbi:hypothetical protein GIB67_026637 [Kingdonia uniflora]|uniref:Uncharacterized protein n=1 Tax=Kingdonia uniflora TaxID=39325 RepID=A0A7J7NIY2_9MAGN|nr:hypothetical protein GIB67_026637 [Kingdonia uniflora]